MVVLKMAPSSAVWSLLLLLTTVTATESAGRSKRQADSVCVQPPKPANGKYECIQDDYYLTCDASCDDGYEFQDKSPSPIENLCDIFGSSWFSGPDVPACVPVCTSPCQNGGQCDAPNHCSCPPGYSGNLCQNRANPCQQPPSPRYGQINCQKQGPNVVCSVSCSMGFRFETTPASSYRCSPSGVWSPAKESIPDCVQDFDVVMPTAAGSSIGTSGTTAHATMGRGAMCVAWGQEHYRTFDNKVYTFSGSCTYTLVKDCSLNSFTVNVINDRNCASGSSCKRELDLYFGDTKVTLRQGSNGPQVTWDGASLTVPTSRSGTVFQQVGRYLTIQSPLGFMVKWDGKESVFFRAMEELRGKTCGLCGVYDGNQDNDFTMESGGVGLSAAAFGTSWKKTEAGEAPCADSRQQQACDTSHSARAQAHCAALLSDPAFTPCHSAVDVQVYFESCKFDCCAQDTDSCTCRAMEAYSRACMEHGLALHWRRNNRCPVMCGGGKIFQECGSSCTLTCANPRQVCTDTSCVDGCYCPPGTVEHAGHCIAADQCPCSHSGQTYRNGQSFTRDCNTCTCQSGTLTCTNKTCTKRCSATGDPHYLTFDGTRFDFMGKCSYYLLHDRDFDIIVDNIQCGQHEYATCTKSVTIDINGMNIKLDHNHQLFVNGREITQLPYEVPGLKVYMVSSLFMKAELANGVSVLWDGRTRVYVMAPSSMMGHTQGLCGTFDNIQGNDLTTPQQIVETNTNRFGNSWQTDSSCRPVPDVLPPNPCDSNPQRKQQAIDMCNKLTSAVFSACHDVEPAEDYLQDCMYDMCACTQNMQDCLCPTLGVYADTCAAKGVHIDWRQQISDCMIQCPGGQEYQVCGNPCERTCRNLAQSDDCKPTCVEGCNCPDGQALNDMGQCVATIQCPCIFDGRQYPAGYATLKGAQMCTCTGAQWSCSRLTFGDNLPDTLQPLCPENSVFKECASQCPKTCDNFNEADSGTCSSDPAQCQSGCECVEGMVLQGDTCINQTRCPCHHGGQDYYEGDVIAMDCNQCTCRSRNWVCETNDCPSTCSSIGDSHYTTFDGKEFQFQGSCDYVLVKSEDGRDPPFQVSTQNVACGTSGVTCSKMVDITVGVAGTPTYYNLQLVRGQSPKPDPDSPFTVRHVGEFFYIDTPFGLSVQWDKGTRVYVRLQTQHMNHVEGLCGNFNSNQNDDFKGPDGGPALVRATEFGDSWKLHDYCAPALQVADTCLRVPQRKPWAQKECGILASDLFSPCHSAVDHTPYMARCVYDTCACNQGGDCECLCTAIAAYAHACANKGYPISWRTNDLCPLNCEDCQAYSPCISPCPKKTCENRLTYNLQCRDVENTCFEGCDRPACPQGQVYASEDHLATCVPEVLCDTPACTVNGQTYREGERIHDSEICNNNCEICNCRHGDVEHISYAPCSTLVAPSQPSDVVTPAPGSCQNKWSDWINAHSPDTEGEKEGWTQEQITQFCPGGKVADIQCMTVTDIPSFSSGETTTCSIENGFSCLNADNDPVPCSDYKIKYQCSCTPAVPSPPQMAQMKTTHTMSLCPPGQVYEPCSFRCDEACDSLRHSTAACHDGNNNCVAGCRQQTALALCGAGEKRVDANTCVPENMCPCLKPDGSLAKPFETWKNPRDSCSDCSCQMGLSLCTSHDPTCTASPSATPTVQPSATCGWSQWMNVDTPSTGSGDVESLATLRSAYQLCDWPINIQCRDVGSLQAVSTGSGVTCDLQTGLTCHNVDHQGGCADFEVRVYCPCLDTMTPSPEAPRTNPMPRTCHHRWSDWINTDSPDGDGDREGWTLQDMAQFCPGGKVTDIQCMTVTDIESFSSGETTHCTVQDGFSCLNAENDPVGCSDYKIKYQCSCAHIMNDEEPTAGPQKRPARCGWTSWLNGHQPTPLGEQETVRALMDMPEQFCSLEDLTAVECRPVGSPAVDPRITEAVTCDLRYDGLLCRSEDLPAGITCPDFQVRFLCEPRNLDCGHDPTSNFTRPTGNPGGHTAPSGHKTPHSEPEYPVCKDGMEEAVALDVTGEQLTASSQKSLYTGASQSLLTSRQDGLHSGGWVSMVDDDQQWLQVAFPAPVTVSGLVTKGRDASSQWVSQFMLLYSLDGQMYHYYYQDRPDQPKVFDANTDSSSEVEQRIQPTTARYFMVKPVTWHGAVAMRLGLLGCQAVAVPTAVPNGVPVAKPPQVPVPEVPEVCLENMGMMNRKIRDDMLSASSFRDIAHAPKRSRLAGSGSWLPARDDVNQYLQVDLLTPHYVTGLTTQGRPAASAFVKTYRVLYSEDGVNWNVYQESSGLDKVWEGNSDSVTPVTNLFSSPIKTRYIRINPRTWSARIALRLELLGCFESYPPGDSVPTATPTAVPRATPSTPVSDSCIVWDQWVDNHQPSLQSRDDFEPIETVLSESQKCKDPLTIQCRTATSEHRSWETSGQPLRCDLWTGLLCNGDDVDGPSCFNYEVRVGCLRQSPECLSRLPTATPTAEPGIHPQPSCYPGMDRSSCPDTCPTGQFCDGARCVVRSECTCKLDNTVIRARDVTTNSQCETCQCLNGEMRCVPKTCTSCSQGMSQLNLTTCSCQCVTCTADQFQCSTGTCIPQSTRCDGVIHCQDDELDCESRPPFIPPTARPTAVPDTTPEILPQSRDYITPPPRTQTECPDRCPATVDIICPANVQVVEVLGECNCTRLACLAVPLPVITPAPEPVCRYQHSDQPEHIYQIGDTWSEGVCGECACVPARDGSGEVSCKRQQCTECQTGERRVDVAGQCCGQCEPAGCVVNNIVYEEGQDMPASRSCYTNTCARDTHGMFVTRETRTVCPSLDMLPACRDGAQRYDSEGCCLQCVPSTLISNRTESCTPCSALPLFPDPRDSVSYLLQHNQQGYVCRNTQPLPHFTQCAGQCGSHTKESLIGSFQATCSCCQPTSVSQLHVTLECEDGSSMEHSYTVAEACGCGACKGGK